MIKLKGNSLYLRSLEPEDIDFVYSTENDMDLWVVSNTQTPYSKYLIKQYLKNAHQDIYEAKQLRLAICKDDNFPALGFIDLFDFDPKNNKAGIGIVIKEKKDRQKNIGAEAMEILIDYSFKWLNLHQLYANIGVENKESLALFDKFGFEKIGIKKEWNLVHGKYEDEAMFQLINNLKSNDI